MAVASRLPLVALVGNPNAGKTTLFNALTGSRAKVGNYPGVTVEKVAAPIPLGEREAEFLDLPGLYSLTAQSVDEQVALESLKGVGSAPPDLVVCVVDVSNLERNLYLFRQVAELGLPVVVALTMGDQLVRQGRTLDLQILRDRLGCAVVPVQATKGSGLGSLKKAIDSALNGEGETRSDFGDDGSVEARYAWASDTTKAAVTVDAALRRKSVTDRIDAFLIHRVFGLAFFVALMYGVFQSIYTLAVPLMDGIETAFGWVGERASGVLAPWPDLQSLVVDGLITGVGSAVVFLPQILILFFFIAVLEGTGYLARAAFLMDRLLGWCGLNGRAFIPLLSSFACAIPGIMAARVMPDERSRLATILVAPLMSCSARLPVYVLLIGAFIQPRFGAGWAGFALFAMHFLGLAVAIPVAWTLNRKVLKGKRLPFVLELPPYQALDWKEVGRTLVLRGSVFLKTAGTIIVLMSMLIWALSTYPKLGETEVARIEGSYQAANPGASEEQVEHHLAEKRLELSALGRVGRAIEPAFLPAGFDWRITTSILAAFPAREVVVPSMGIIFGLGADQDGESLQLNEALSKATWPDGRPLFTPWTAVGLMVFFALCAQCMATLATVKRETNSWKWAGAMFVYMTTLAYLGAVLVHQIGRWLGA